MRCLKIKKRKEKQVKFVKSISIIKKQIMKTWFKTFPKNIYHNLDFKIFHSKTNFFLKKNTHRMSETSVIYHLPQNLKYN